MVEYNYLECRDFEDNHILDVLLEDQPYIYYPVSNELKNTYRINCVKHYFDYQIYVIRFQSKIYYIIQNPETIIDKVNNYLQNVYRRDTEIFNKLSYELKSYIGSPLDDEFEMLLKRHNASRERVVKQKYWTEPFQVVSFIPIDQLIPRRLTIEIVD